MPRRNFESVKEDIARLSQDLGPVQLMEVCGTHTVSLFRSGIRSILPANLKLVSGPGCPVCVTARGYVDLACRLAERPDVIVCTYGDMVRVPGESSSLEAERARGADVRVVYSARDALRIATQHPGKTIVFLAVGFETTAPATAATILQADQADVENFLVLAAHKLVVPAMTALLKGGAVPIDGFLCPGHVSVIIGSDAYRPIVENFEKPCVVAGFEPLQILEGIRALVRQVRDRQAKLENVYAQAVSTSGNEVAVRMMERVFVVTTATWRALGNLPESGLELADEFERFDVLKKEGLTISPDRDPPGCRCGEIIQGKVEPPDCSLFAAACTPGSPIGPCMVSSEGTCAAWYKYNRVSMQSPEGKARVED